MSKNHPTQGNQTPQTGGMRIVSCHELADHVYEVVIHTEDRAPVTRRVLMLPSSAIDEAASGRDCVER